MIRGEGATAAVDWWQLGVLIFEMATGDLPFQGEGDDDRQLFTAIIKGHYSWPPPPDEKRAAAGNGQTGAAVQGGGGSRNEGESSRLGDGSIAGTAAGAAVADGGKKAGATATGYQDTQEEPEGLFYYTREVARIFLEAFMVIILVLMTDLRMEDKVNRKGGCLLFNALSHGLNETEPK